MNKHYNIAFVGLGSIGTRHLKNVQSYLDGRGDSYTIDLYRSVLRDELPNGVTAQYLYADVLPEDRAYDIVFITNPTSLHLEAVEKFINHTKSYFIEKPVFDHTFDASKHNGLLNQLAAKVAYVACPLRYNPVLQYIHESGIYKDAISVRAISSSYLPDWRPGQDYRQCYSAHKELGGGVGIDLIHEWDYLTWLFGMPIEVKSIRAKLSNLEIDSDDLAIYIGQTESVGIEVHLDYVGRKTIRVLEMFLPDDTIKCDLVNGSIEHLVSGESVHFSYDRNTGHMAEIVRFFDIVDNKIDNDSTVAHAIEVLNIAKGE